jgi:hypothetical protein
MYRRVIIVAPESEYEARRIAVTRDGLDSLRCGHPRGPVNCTHLIACADCPFAEALEYDVAA